MSQQQIEACIEQQLNNEIKELALDFVSYLIANGMQPERIGGYWENQHYYGAKYRNEYVCFILVNGTGDEAEFSPLTIWLEDGGSHWYDSAFWEERIRQSAWENVDFCEHCGSCGGGTRKRIFGKEFDNVCLTPFRFVNPTSDTMVYIKKLIEIRKRDILAREQAIPHDFIQQREEQKKCLTLKNISRN